MTTSEPDIDFDKLLAIEEETSPENYRCRSRVRDIILISALLVGGHGIDELAAVSNLSIGDVCSSTDLVRERVVFLEGHPIGYNHLLAHSELSIKPTEHLPCVDPKKKMPPAEH